MDTKTNYREIFAKRIKDARGNRTLQEISNATGIPMITISRYENNKREIGLENLCKLAKFYDEDLNYLTGIKDF